MELPASSVRRLMEPSAVRDYMLIRSRRKTIALYVRTGGKIEVRAPLHTPVEVIDGFVDSRADWIAHSLQKIKEAEEKAAAFSVLPGSRLLWMGAEYPAVLESGASARIEGGRFLLPGNAEHKNRTAVRCFYQSAAERHLENRTSVWAKRMGLTPASVKITNAKRRWGSCSGKNALCFTWRLILTPPVCIDYVIVHELCHILEHNHSAAFWQEVERILPDYKQRRQMLQDYGRRIDLQNWD